MTQIPTTPYPPAPYAPRQADTAGVLGGRLLAYLVDLVIVGLLWGVFVVVLLVLGFLTFGLAWMLIAPLFPLVAVLYSGLTVSGPNHGTVGMRMAGVELRTLDGGTVPFVVAAVHAIFFYVSVSFLTPFVVLFGLLRSDRRLLHDLLAGVIAVRRR